MIELQRDGLVFSFPEVHREAKMRISFQRTLRIPDDGETWPLPPGLGEFPLRHVDDFAGRAPRDWLPHGGVMLPMYQAEALWIYFSSPNGYPFTVRVATGKIDAVTGEEWTNDIVREPQNYLVAPTQPWLDGYCVEKGLIRQFVAMPLGSGYSAEEQITGEAEHGGLQLLVHPMKREAWERDRARRERMLVTESGMMMADFDVCASAPAEASMGLAPGGRMRQEIYDDPYSFDDWDTTQQSRCFVHIANSLVWQAITDEPPPYPPATSKRYTQAGLPWFDHYGEEPAIDGSAVLSSLKSVLQLGKEKGDVPLPENEGPQPETVIHLGKKKSPDEVREGSF